LRPICVCARAAAAGAAAPAIEIIPPRAPRRKMTGLSGAFREQARVDLGLAQAAARGSSSGHALGESMFLAQQCVEKQLKSIPLRLWEAMGTEGGDGGIPGMMDHPIYHSLHGVYTRIVGQLRQEAGNLHGPAHDPVASLVENVGKRWREHAGPKSPKHDDFWMDSLNAGLPAKRALGLRRFDNDMAGLRRGLPPGGRDPRLRPAFGEAPDGHGGVRRRVCSKRQAGRLYSEYRRGRSRRGEAVEKGARPDVKGMLSPDITDYFRRATPEAAQGLIARRNVVEFGFGLLCDYVGAYARLFPHSILGRYPKRLDDGRLTTEVYALREDSVLYSLHVTIRHDHDRLCGHSALLDELCRLGHKRGYW